MLFKKYILNTKFKYVTTSTLMAQDISLIYFFIMGYLRFLNEDSIQL